MSAKRYRRAANGTVNGGLGYGSASCRNQSKRFDFKPAAALWRAVGCDKAGVPGPRLGARDAQAGSFKMRPRLPGAIAAYGADVQPVALGQRVGHAGFDLGSKSGQYCQCGSNKRSNSDG